MEFTPFVQALGSLLLLIIGWNVRKITSKLDDLAKVQGRNAQRLVRIETKLGLPDFTPDDLA